MERYKITFSVTPAFCRMFILATYKHSKGSNKENLDLQELLGLLTTFRKVLPKKNKVNTNNVGKHKTESKLFCALVYGSLDLNKIIFY